jgi:hypothetical protein
MVEEDWNMQTNFKKNSLPTKVGLTDQPNTQIDKSICLQALDLQSKANTQTNDNKSPKKVHFETKLHQCQLIKPILQQPSFFIGPYRTIPLKPLPIPPVSKWNHVYTHITSRVDSHRK